MCPSRSNHYVDKVGGYHKIWICTLNPPNASPLNRNVSILTDCSLRPRDWARRAGKWSTDQSFMVPTNLVNIVVGPGRGTWDRDIKNIFEK